MKNILLLVCLLTTCICKGQINVAYADSIRKHYRIPELSYAVVDAKTVLEIAALGKHSIQLTDTAS
jgi:hypothetical protein